MTQETLERAKAIKEMQEKIDLKINYMRRALEKSDNQEWRDTNDYRFVIPLKFIRQGINEYIKGLEEDFETLHNEFFKLGNDEKQTF